MHTAACRFIIIPLYNYTPLTTISDCKFARCIIPLTDDLCRGVIEADGFQTGTYTVRVHLLEVENRGKERASYVTVSYLTDNYIINGTSSSRIYFYFVRFESFIGCNLLIRLELRAANGIRVAG